MRRITGPAFTHPLLPYRAHFSGSATARGAPAFYLDALHDLVHAWVLDVRDGAYLLTSTPSSS